MVRGFYGGFYLLNEQAKKAFYHFRILKIHGDQETRLSCKVLSNADRPKT